MVIVKDQSSHLVYLNIHKITKFRGLKIKCVENYFFLEKKNVTSEGTVSQNVLYYQPLPITHYPVRFYANNYFE